LILQASEMKRQLKECGLLVIRGVDLDEKELIQLAALFGDEVVETSANNIHANFDSDNK